MFRLILCFVVLIALVALLLPAAPLQTVFPPHGMPPHPRLLEQVTQGQADLPRFLTNPAYRARLGIDTPPRGPRRLRAAHLNALAVVVDFNDKVNTVTASYFDTLIFAPPVAGRGSVNDYFYEVSYGQVDIVTVNVPSSLGWRRAPQAYSYYVGYCGPNCGYCIDGTYPNNCQKLAEDIVDAINGVVNFANYDNDGDGIMEPIMLIHAGPGAEFTGSAYDIWSHSWGLHSARYYDGVWISQYVIMPEYWTTVSSTSSDMTIGVFAHEMGHGFWGLPDLYDRDYSSEGIGSWSLMASGSWNGPNSGGWGSDGSSPAWPDAWSRVQMGYATFADVDSPSLGQSIPQAYNNPAPATTVFKLHSLALANQEHFLIENRQQVSGSYEQYLPGAGLFIWHVDEAMNVYTKQNDYECSVQPHYLCDDNYHYLVALEQADGQRHLERNINGGDTGDAFPGLSNNRIWNMSTNPESSSWYGTVSVDTCIGVVNISNSGAAMTADLLTCGTPLNLTATAASQSQIALTWMDTSSIETGFKIERSLDGSSWTQIATVGPNVVNYLDGSRSCGTTYYYRVRAYARSDSAYSNVASATTLPCSPAAPGGLTAAPVSQTQINLTWTDNSNNEDGFEIERSPDGASSWTPIYTTTANATSYSNTGLTCGTPYYYRVRAYNAGGNSAYSNVANATTLPCSPAAPGGLTAASVLQTQINLSWTDNSNNEDGFKIERSLDGASSWTPIYTTTANATSYSNTGLTCGTPYYYRVRAYNAGGSSGYSNVAHAVTVVCAPQAPTALVATAMSASQIDLTWVDNSDNEDGFRLERSPNGSSGWTQIISVGAGVTVYSDTGLSFGTTYYYRVLAYNAGGNSVYSNIAQATTRAHKIYLPVVLRH